MGTRHLVRHLATAVKEAAAAQEGSVGGLCFQGVGTSSQVALGSRTQPAAAAVQTVSKALEDACSDIKDQHAPAGKQPAAGASKGPAPPKSSLASVPALLSQSLLGHSALAANLSTDAADNTRTLFTPVHRAPTASAGRFNPAGSRGPNKSSHNSSHGHHNPLHTYTTRSKSTTSSASIGFNKQIMSASSTAELLDLVNSVGPQLDFFNISSALSRVPKLVAAYSGGHIDKQGLGATEIELVDALAGLMEDKLTTFDARGLANAAWAFGKLRYSPKQLPALITQRSLEKIQEFTPQNLSNMLWSHVYLQHRDDAFLKVAAARVRARIRDFKPQELSNVVWAFASLDYRDTDLLRDAARQCTTLQDAFKEQELSNLVWAFARSEFRDPKLFSALLQPIMAKVATLSPQGVSNIAWGLSHIGLPNAAFLKAVSDKWTTRLKEFDPQALSTLTWSLGAAGVKIEPLLEGLVDECLHCTQHLAPQHLSNILWACATLNFYYGSMLEPWARATMHMADQFEPQGLSNILWAFAKLGHFEPKLMDRLADTLLAGKLDSCSAQGLSNIVWAYATAGHVHTPLLTRLADRIAKVAPSFSAQNCSVSLWGLATLRHAAPHTVDAILRRVGAEIQSGSRSVEAQNIANTLWACARMGHGLGPHGALLKDKALKLAPRMRQQELTNCLWSLAMLDVLDPETFTLLAAYAGSVAEGMNNEGLHQAYHAQLLFHSLLSRTSPSTPRTAYPCLPEPLHACAAHAWRTTAVDVRVSRLQSEVNTALNAAGVSTQLEALTHDGLFSVDVALVGPGDVPVALEVDGVHHFASNLPGVPLRDVLMRKRLLQERGWTVVNLSYQQWKELPGASPKEKGAALHAFVIRELEAAGQLGTQQLLSSLLPAATASLPASLPLSLQDLMYTPSSPTGSPTGSYSPTSSQVPSDSDLLQQLLALAPTLGASGLADRISAGSEGSASPPNDWMSNLAVSNPMVTNMLGNNTCYNWATTPSCQQQVAMPTAAAMLGQMNANQAALGLSITPPSPFQPMAVPPASPPPPQATYPNMPNPAALLLQQPLSTLSPGAAGLGMMGWAGAANTANTMCGNSASMGDGTTASLINSLLEGATAGRASGVPAAAAAANPHTFSSLSLALVESLLKLRASEQPAPAAPLSPSMVMLSEQMERLVPEAVQCNMGLPAGVPLDPSSLGFMHGAGHLAHAGQAMHMSAGPGHFRAAAESNPCGWTVWSGLPPVLNGVSAML